MQHALVFPVIHLYNYFLNAASVHSFFYAFFFKFGNDKLAEGSTISACPRLMCFFNRDDTKGTNSSKKFVFDVCVFCFI